MVIYEVLTGAQPFYEREWVYSEVMYHVVRGERPTKPDDAEQIGFGGGTWGLVKECWMEEPASRPETERVLTHLTCVAASSSVVGPTPEIARSGDVPELGSSSEFFELPACDDSHVNVEGGTCRFLFPAQNKVNPPIITDQISKATTVSNVSPTSTVSPVSTLATRTLGTITPVSSRSSEDPPETPAKPPTPVKPDSPPTRLAGKLLVKPEDVLLSTIPLPIFFAKKVSKRDRLATFFDSLKPHRTIGHSTPAPQRR